MAVAAVEECELPGTLPAYRERSYSPGSGEVLSNHGYTKTTICTPEELIRAETVGRRSAPRGLRGAGLLRGGARLQPGSDLCRPKTPGGEQRPPAVSLAPPG